MQKTIGAGLLLSHIFASTGLFPGRGWPQGWWPEGRCFFSAWLVGFREGVVLMLNVSPRSFFSQGFIRETLVKMLALVMHMLYLVSDSTMSANQQTHFQVRISPW